jgi:methanogenic corrinoid protein MtbC1
MLKWCSYCQRFLGETPDFHNLNVTHGICTACAPGAAKFTESDFQLAESLRDIQHQLREAGRRSDLHAAERIIENAAAANVRAVDVLIGIIAPALYQVGEDWRRGIIGVAEEHRFTAFCEELFNRVASRVTDVAPAPAADQEPSEFLLMNAPGNKHTLAIRILTLWLRSRGAAARVLDSTPSPEELAAMVVRNPPKSLLISMALAEQGAGVTALAQRISQLPAAIRPKVIIGGYAVKLGLVSAIPGAQLMADISSL